MADQTSSGPGVVTLSFAMLPSELISHILEYLVPAPPEIGDSKPVTYNKLVPGEAWFDFTRSRRGLWSLCLTSRTLSAIARPLLYRVVTLLDEDGFLLFARALLEDFSRTLVEGFAKAPFPPPVILLGRHVQFLSVHLTLSSEPCIREMRRTMGRLFDNFKSEVTPKAYDSVAEAWLDMDFEDIPQLVMVLILDMLTQLDTFLLQVPICDDDAEYGVLFQELRRRSLVLNTDLTNRNTAVWPSFNRRTSSTNETGYPKIKTLLLQGDPELRDHFETGNCSCDAHDIWGCQPRLYWPIVEACPNLRTIEVSNDDGMWQNEGRGMDRTMEPYFPGVEHLYLHGSAATPRSLRHILANAPALQTLYMTPLELDDLTDALIDDDLYEAPESLDEALLSHGRNLRHLDLAWSDCRHYEFMIGPEGRLASLRQMDRLETLCIQLAVLYGNSPANLLTPLADLLPPSLVELTLQEWWWSDVEIFDRIPEWRDADKVQHYQSKSDYRAGALRFLSQFASVCPNKLPRLRKVRFLTKIPWTWTLENWVTMDDQFEEVNRVLADNGVSFLAEEG